MLIGSPPIVLVYMCSYYDGSMTHVTYFWILMNTSMSALLRVQEWIQGGNRWFYLNILELVLGWPFVLKTKDNSDSYNLVEF